MRAARVAPSGSVLDPGGFLAPTGTLFQYNPCAIWDGGNFLVCWNDLSDLGQDICAARITPQGAVLDPAGFAVSTAENTQMLTGLEFGVRQRSCGLGGPPCAGGASDVFAARIRPDGAVLDPAGIAVSSNAAEQFPARGRRRVGQLVRRLGGLSSCQLLGHLGRARDPRRRGPGPGRPSRVTGSERAAFRGGCIRRQRLPDGLGGLP